MTIRTSDQAKFVQIMASARDLFFRHGYAATTTDLIRRTAGVSKTTIYSYFPAKSDLFLVVVRLECLKLIRRAKCEPVEGRTVREALVRIGLGVLDVALEPSALSLVRLVIAEAPRFPDLGRSLLETGAPLVSGLADCLIEAGWHGHLVIEDTRSAARHLVGMVLQQVHLQCLLGFRALPGAEEKREIVEMAVNDFIRAHSASHPRLTNFSHYCIR